ncbi:MAG: metallophosphoesterase [Armatimonas sp.]
MLWAIGDVHGQSELLARLLTLLPRSPNDQTVFLGDYIDRGPDSRGVVLQVLDEIEQGAIALWGNHEDMAAAAYGLPSLGRIDSERAAETWLIPHNGGPTTLESFHTTYPGPCPEALQTLFPLLKTHWVDPETHVEFVHGCAPPGRSLDAVALEEPTDERPYPGAAVMLWQGPPSTGTGERHRAIVVGHTSIKSGYPERYGNHLVIDTNAARGGPLTALGLCPGHPLFICQVLPDSSYRFLSETPLGTWE